jgi:hypothetical protein
MRSRTDPRARDQGAVLVWVALMMTVLLGVGAIVIDIGALYVEKRQLQNGADAGALAVAQDCAGGDCGDAAGRAHAYGELNAKDARAALDVVCGHGPGLTPCATAPPARAADATGWVRVALSTETPDGGHEVDFVLGPIMGAFAGHTVHASAIAAWGSLSGGAFAPFVFSVCEYVAMGGSFDALTFPDDIGYIYFHGRNRNDPKTTPCRPSPSGQDIPGGFGRVDSTGCVATLSQGMWASVDPGNDMVRGCNPTSWQGQEIVLALYDQVRGTGTNGQYHIVGFVGFKVMGYRFNGNRTYSSAGCPLVGPASVTYFCGKFTRVSTDAGDFGTGPNYGASVIKMIG